MGIKHLELKEGALAHAALQDQTFLTRWRRLHESCLHATACQAPEFACAWYEAYKDQWEPVLLYIQDEKDGELKGLFLLAYNAQAKTLTHAGDRQSEYHVWLALPDQNVSFLSEAWNLLVQRFDFTMLYFRFLPDGELGEILKSVPNIHDNVVIRKRSRPLLKLDPEDVKATFAKKSNKSRFNRLKRLGKLEFRRITDIVEHEQVFDDLVNFYDFRQGAVNHATHFRQDPRKRKFYSSIFATDPNKVHVTVTYLNDKPIAGLWGLISGKMINIAMIMHSPFLTEHSPGKLHIMQLSQYLLEEGKEVLDITPGGAPWKERFANAHDEVAEVFLYKETFARMRAEKLYAFFQWIKRSSARCGVTTDQMRATLSLLSSARPAVIMSSVKDWIRKEDELRIYRLDRPVAEIFKPDERVHCNTLSELLAVKVDDIAQPLEGFLSNSLSLLEQGELVYTISVENRLVHYGWMNIKQSEAYFKAIAPSITVPAGSVVFHDFYSVPSFRRHGLFRATVAHMLHEAFVQDSTQHVYICIPKNNQPALNVIESLGFDYQGSCFYERRFGVEKKWASLMSLN